MKGLAKGTSGEWLVRMGGGIFYAPDVPPIKNVGITGFEPVTPTLSR